MKIRHNKLHNATQHNTAKQNKTNEKKMLTLVRNSRSVWEDFHFWIEHCNDFITTKTQQFKINRNGTE
jgi:hypothetical protein